MDTLLTLPQDLILGSIGMLDALPDGARAALAAILLTGFLRLFEIRIPAHEVQYGQSFRKAALIALIVTPVFIWLVPASRMTVFVEELAPAGETARPFWIGMLLLWIAGVLMTTAALVRTQRSTLREMNALPPIDDEKLIARLAHWQRRLGMEETLQLAEIPGAAPRLLSSGTRIAFPAAARHWPGNLQDVLLIVALIHLKRRHRRWHLIGQLASCLYWPVPWVQTLTYQLVRDFQYSVDELAESCYRDRLGYDRALRQLAQRLVLPTGIPQVSGQAHREGWMPGTMAERFHIYIRSVHHLLQPDTDPAWRLDDLLRERGAEHKLAWNDPYDRVALFVGQAAFFAFLLTGATLQERPPEADYEYSMPFELFWKEHFHRNLELQEKAQPSGP